MSVTLDLAVLSQMPSRFRAKVEVTDTCWLWQGTKVLDGYGKCWKDGKLQSAHRVIYEKTVAPIPAGLQIDHLCRVRNCVNPAHMEIVTSRENTLRGESFAARNARKTHCKHGHEFTAENTLLVENGYRQCRICVRRKSRDWWRKHRGVHV